jgi:PleD family two-component response regulator
MRDCKKLSESDGLTGVANRRLFDAELIAAWQRRRASRRPTSP